MIVRYTVMRTSSGRALLFNRRSAYRQLEAFLHMASTGSKLRRKVIDEIVRIRDEKPRENSYTRTTSAMLSLQVITGYSIYSVCS